MADEHAQEKRRLERIAETFRTEHGFNGRLEHYRIRTVVELVRGTRILEIGCAEGMLAAALADGRREVVAVDGSAALIAQARERYTKPHLTFHQSLYEEFVPDAPFDTVVLVNILEHVDDPVDLLRKARFWTKQGGCIIILVPNAWSLHRRIGAQRGFLADVHDLNDTDRRVGHRRVYDHDLLEVDVAAAGLVTTRHIGLFLKPLSESQMNEWSDALIDAYYELGKELPEWCSELIVVAEFHGSLS